MEIYAHRIKMDDKGNVDSNGQSPRVNFDDFFHGFLTIFIVLVGDDWHLVYYDAIRSVGYASAIYFVSLVILGNWILLNLFLAILLGNFNSTEMTVEQAEDALMKRHKRREVTPHHDLPTPEAVNST